MDEGRFCISMTDLYRTLGTAATPLVIDVRRGAAFEADEWMVPGALRRPPEAIERWGSEIPSGSAIVVYCAHGHEVSQTAATALREIAARRTRLRQSSRVSDQRAEARRTDRGQFIGIARTVFRRSRG
jgi:rhodanese-related sulfurtransferase